MEPQLTERFEQAEILFLSIELAVDQWKVAFSDGQEVEVKSIEARNFGHLQNLLDRYREQFQLPDSADVFSCYEAGQDGFWVHRVLEEQLDIVNAVIDPASIEDNNRVRAPKTDSIDAETMVHKLVQYHQGNTDVFSVCKVPSKQDQDDRRLNRELAHLREERKMHRNRIQSLLRLEGVEVETFHGLQERLDELETGDGRALGTNRKAEIKRQLQRLERVNEDIENVIKQQKEELQERSGERKMIMINRLRALKGIALDSAWRLVMEAFGWREFENRFQVGGCFGLDPTPHNSGQKEQEQGISKAGSNRLRDLAVQVAWNWKRFQPESQLTRWMYNNFNMTSKGDKKRGIVALARKLMSVLDKYAKGEGEAPWGATLNKEELLE